MEDDKTTNTPILTPEQFAERMRAIRKEYYETQDDEEVVHLKMDGEMLKLLRSLGYGEGCDIFCDTPMWYA